MGIQNNVVGQNLTSSLEFEAVVKTAETVNYITDLLNELQKMANFQGLKSLSTDLETVIRKHMI